MSIMSWILVLLLAMLAAGTLFVWRKSKQLEAAKEEDEKTREKQLEELPTIPVSAREEDAIYQWSSSHGDRLVARVVNSRVDEQAREVHFTEITHSDYLLLPDECEFQKYKIEIQTVEDAVKMDKTEPEKGRILRQVSASILGYVEH